MGRSGFVYSSAGKTVATLLVVAGLIYSFSRIKSSVTKNVDPFIYQLPFAKGTPHRVVQGYGGLFSHKNMACLDFEMPEGTPVFASRGGTVYRYKDDSNTGGPLPWFQKMANFIIIMHGDSSFGCYWHLKAGGVAVKRGEVEMGQLIGYSGSTGFVLAPHLHFSVKTKLDYSKDAYIKTRFKTANNIQFLENGRSYFRPME